ncbi:carboxy-cis,cis-muconate cyclase [Lindgomyces ingoldianus]|uniref:Carboxy-cis,cis-muconate cyclase n=1 Tax=Lindgomyces ingoldianus TaxID=673940 RepID=A0ACB6QY78_9PLEO|nr:carboxy-cis,cis-muconate cyclase [Lindgomyces ingoldianus]KAF2471767.1 carboxy-cis,cis-muconate cyclase [Lindgomyces ingoldianus]
MHIFLIVASLIPIFVSATTHQLIVGSFGTNFLYTLEFDDEALTLDLIYTTNTSISSSWIALSYDKKNLYGTGWGSSTPSFVSYALGGGTNIQYSTTLPLGGNCSSTTKPIFIVAETKKPYTVYGVPFGGSAGCGSVMSVDKNGALNQVIQNLTYLSTSGVHGMALNAENTFIYSADDSANSIWTHAVDPTSGELEFVSRLGGPSTGSDPRHVAIHPNGKYLYVLLEGSSQVALYSIDPSSGIPSYTNITYPLIPSSALASDYWADEVMLSASSKYLWATNRGRSNTTLGYISAFLLANDGSISKQLFLTETTNSGGSANAVATSDFSDEWVALTDSSVGFVQIWRLSGNGTVAKVVAQLNIHDGGCCANAVWYS